LTIQNCEGWVPETSVNDRISKYQGFPDLGNSLQKKGVFASEKGPYENGEAKQMLACPALACLRKSFGRQAGRAFASRHLTHMPTRAVIPLN
jgi:hypothetical protein